MPAFTPSHHTQEIHTMSITRITLLITAIVALAGAVALQNAAQAQPAASPPRQPEGSPPAHASEQTAARKPDLIAIELYADWCGTCKRMMPAAMEMRENTAAEPVLWVRLDRTDRESKQAEYHMAALGLGELWAEHAGRTGYILLVDPETKRAVGRLTAEMDGREMTRTVEQAL
jgi:thiol:disulfide interchange protein